MAHSIISILWWYISVSFGTWTLFELAVWALFSVAWWISAKFGCIWDWTHVLNAHESVRISNWKAEFKRTGLNKPLAQNDQVILKGFTWNFKLDFQCWSGKVFIWHRTTKNVALDSNWSNNHHDRQNTPQTKIFYLRDKNMLIIFHIDISF